MKSVEVNYDWKVTKWVPDERDNLSFLSCTAPYIPYRVAISAQNSNPVAGKASNAITFSREGSKFIISGSVMVWSDGG